MRTKYLYALICALCLLSYSAVTAQEDPPKTKRVTFYPINLPYVLFGKVQTSLEIDGKEANNSVVFGLHYNWILDRYNIGQNGSGLGAEIQYRIDFNKDPNILFRDRGYFAPYFEYDYLNYEEDIFGGNAEPGVVRRSMVGILTGVRRETPKGNRLDLFYGIGIGRSNRYGYSTLSLGYKGGIQLGLR